MLAESLVWWRTHPNPPTGKDTAVAALAFIHIGAIVENVLEICLVFRKISRHSVISRPIQSRFRGAVRGSTCPAC